MIPGVQDKRFDVAVDGIADTRATQKVAKFVDYSNDFRKKVGRAAVPRSGSAMAASASRPARVGRDRSSLR
jgi:hypothetical protein